MTFDLAEPQENVRIGSEREMTGAKFEHGIPKPLFEVRMGSNRHYDVSADGKRFLVIQGAANSSSASLMVVLNWLAGVKK
jgi:hypothetical protein